VKLSVSKTTAFLLCAVLLFIGLNYFPINILTWDIFGYYLYLPMTFIYHDLGIKDYSVIQTIIDKYHSTGTFYQALQMPDGVWVMRYGIGMSVLYSPFFFIAHLFAKVTGFPADGFSTPYQYGIWAGCMIYTFLGVFMLRRSLMKFFDEKIAAVTLTIIVLGTNYTLHTSMHGQGAMTHNILFTLYTFILWFTIRWHETNKMKHAVLLAISCGLAALVRPTEVIGLLIPILWGVYNKQTFNEKLELIKKNKIKLLVFSLIMLAIGSIQFTYWRIYSGRFIFDSYYNPGEGIDFPPHTLHTLFSFRNGWLIYTPVIIFALVGFYFLYKKNKTIFTSAFIYFIISLWVVSSWTVWWYGQCFSQRGLIASYVMLSIPLGYFLDMLRTKANFIKFSVLGLIGFFILLNVFQSWQEVNGILQSPRATSKYWMAAFGKTSASAEDQKLLFMEWPVNGVEIFPNDNSHIKNHTWSIGFEPSDGYPQERLSKEIFHSGTSSYIMDSIATFSPSIEKRYSDITDKYYAWIRVSVWVYPTADVKKNPTYMITTFMHGNKAYKYKGTGTDQLNLEVGKWSQITVDYLTPEAVRNSGDRLSVYIWNNSKGKIYIDDLKVESFEPKNDIY
jgi:hypothetical protein